jgi:hypothetical protein
MFFSTTPRPESLQAIADVKLTPFWLDDPASQKNPTSYNPDPNRPRHYRRGLHRSMWTALQAKQADPNRDVVLLEAGEVAIGASGRNGGFCAASLTHGFSNGKSRWEKELAKLIKLGEQNLDGIEATDQRIQH